MFYKVLGRNIKLFVRDRVSLFFSLLSVVIVIGLYALFLAQLQINDVKAAVNNMVSDDAIGYLINSWILAGLLSIISVTSTLGALGVMVQDREKKILKDFKSSPIRSTTYPVSVMVNAGIVGFCMGLVAFAGYTVFIVVTTGYMFTWAQILQTAAFLLLAVLSTAGIMGFMVSFFTTNSSFSSASVVIGTVIGFVTGVYVPLGSLPGFVQTVVKVLPFGHTASVFRKILTSESVRIAFEHAPGSVKDEYLTSFGINLKFGNSEVATWMSILFLCVLAVAFVMLFFVNYYRKRKEI